MNTRWVLDKLRLFSKQDYSVGTEAFRDALLQRCLEELHYGRCANGPADDDPAQACAPGDPAAKAWAPVPGGSL